MENVQHGGALDRAIATYGGKREEWLDLSTGINPNPYPVPIVPQYLWHRLPDENAMNDCLAAARSYYDVPGEGAI
ncbi:MAG: threonine-phosphate decarboxylase, partial [Pseudomonadota bacterium]